MNRKTKIYTFLAAIVGHVFWGFSFIASHRAQESAHIFILLSHRFLVAFAVMSMLVLAGLAKLRLRGKRVLLLVALGMAQPVIYFLGEQFGLLHSSTIFSGVMIAMIPIVSVLAAAPILGEKPTVGQLLFGLISVGGVVGIGLLSKSSGTLDGIGVITLVIAVCGAAAYTLLSRGISREFSPFERTYMMMVMGAAVFTALAAGKCWGDPASYWQPFRETEYLLSILFLGVCCSVICYFLSSYAITNLTVAQETVFSNLTTAVSVFAGAVILREPFSWWGLICCLLILLGIYGVQRTSPRERETDHASEAEK